MAYRRRAVQTDLITGDSLPGSTPLTESIAGDIPAPTGKSNAGDDGGDGGGQIVAASQATVYTSSVSVPVTVTQEKTVLATPTPTATSTPSATPAPAHAGLATGAIVGIVVAVVVILMIPAAYLIWRSHQMKKEEEWRASQRSSQEAMIVKESVEPKRDNGPPPPRPRRDLDETPRERPTNSLGLFNFDLGSPSPAPVSPQKSPEDQKSGPRLSIARTLQMRRSEVSVVNQERRSQQQIADLRNGLRNNPPTNRNSRELPDGSSPPPPDSKFAPLNNIGTAVSVGRPKFNRNGSSSTIPRQFSPPPPQEMPRPRTATGARQSPSQNDMSRPYTATSPRQSPPQNDMSRPYKAFSPRQPPPGTQDMRQAPGLLIAENLPSSRITNPPISAYSMSNYHDSLRPEPPEEPKLESNNDQPTLQPPEPVVYGRAVSPVHRSISPINNYQLPTFGLGGNDRFSWGVGNTMTHNEEAERRKMNDLSRKNSKARERGYNSTRNNPAERQSEVSNLSYNPVDDYRKSNGRAISPVESDEDFGMRTREYR